MKLSAGALAALMLLGLAALLSDAGTGLQDAFFGSFLADSPCKPNHAVSFTAAPA